MGALNPHDSQLEKYTYEFINPKTGQLIGKRLYHESEFYAALTALQITATNETLIILYKIYCAGYDEGYECGY